MVREFSEEKKQELFMALNAIDNAEWKSFAAWSIGSADDFGDWVSRLELQTYVGKIDAYQSVILDTNSSTRSQIDAIFQNVAETDLRYAGLFREHEETVSEQISKVQTLHQVIQSVNGGGAASKSNASTVHVDAGWLKVSQDVLRDELEKWGICDPREQQKIIDIMTALHPVWLARLYYARGNVMLSEKIMNIILSYYNNHADQLQMEYVEKILPGYLEQQGITDQTEQQKIIQKIKENAPSLLIRLYKDIYDQSRTEENALKAIISYYELHKMDITLADVEGLKLENKELDETQKKTFVECWNFLGQMGLSETHIIAVMANMYEESQFSPTNAYDGKYPGIYNYSGDENPSDETYEFESSDNIAFGIIQWRDAGRKQALYDYADKHNGEVTDLEMQLGYFKEEMEVGVCKGKWIDFLEKETLEDATEYFLDEIEVGPSGSLEKRCQHAETISAWYSNLPQ